MAVTDKTAVTDKEKALAETFKAIEKQYGKGAVMKLGDKALEAIEVIPSGSIALDVALGVGGYPKGRIIEIYGPESSGKTTFALHAIAEAQKNGGYAAFVDAEHALDPTYAKALGVDTDNLILSQPDNGEQALEIVEALVRSNAIDIIVIEFKTRTIYAIGQHLTEFAYRHRRNHTTLSGITIAIQAVIA